MEEEIHEKNNQTQGDTGLAVPAGEVNTSATEAGLSDAAGTVLGGIVGGMIEGIGSIISDITD